MVRTIWRWARPVGGAAVLAVLALHLGTGPFVAGLAHVDLAAVVAAVALTAVTTTASAWRWSRISAAFGVPVPMGGAVASYYRSQLLNSVLPGGVVGDVERGVRHGRAAQRVRRSLAAVATERGVGQVVQLFLTAVVLAVAPTPFPRIVAVAVAAALAFLALVAAVWVRRDGAAIAGRELPGLVAVSAVVVAGHCATFVVAARAVGVTDTARVLPIALLVLVAMSVPLSVGGWGPREGVAGWAFGAAGLGTATGVSAAVVYGVVTLLAVLPGVLVLLAPRLRPVAARHGARSLGRRPVHG